MPNGYFILDGQFKRGPFSVQKLEELYNANIISLDSRLQQENTVGFQTYKEVLMTPLSHEDMSAPTTEPVNPIGVPSSSRMSTPPPVPNPQQAYAPPPPNPNTASPLHAQTAYAPPPNAAAAVTQLQPVSETAGWLMAFFPILIPVTAIFLFGGVSFLLSFGANSVVLILDRRKISEAGYDMQQMSQWWMFVLVPVYLFQRAALLKHSKAYAITWCVVFGLSLVFGL